LKPVKSLNRVQSRNLIPNQLFFKDEIVKKNQFLKLVKRKKDSNKKNGIKFEKRKKKHGG
jgi:hypothetical protein